MSERNKNGVREDFFYEELQDLLDGILPYKTPKQLMDIFIRLALEAAEDGDINLKFKILNAHRHK